MDTDRDGRISRAEAKSDSKLGKGFSKADRNGDGYLDQTEFYGRSGSKSSSSSQDSSSGSMSRPQDSSSSTTPNNPGG